MDARIGVDRLLEHATALRRLARRLARDPAEADDLLQDTWARAIEASSRAPLEIGSLRAWLRTVLRNRHREMRRSEALQREHEPRAARHERVGPDAGELPDAAELEERLRLNSALARALLELPEPYRAAVTLRFLDGLPGAEVARREGISHAALRQRLARGMALLRERLDRDLGSRRAWTLVALMPREPSGAPILPTPLLAATAMSTTTKITAASIVLVLSLAAIGVWVGREPLEPDQVGILTGTGAALSGPDDPVAAASDADRDRAAIDVGARGHSDLASAIDRDRDLHGVVLGPDGAPVGGASVRVERCESTGWTDHDVKERDRFLVVARSTTASDGTFAVRLEPGRPYSLLVDAESFAPAHLAQRSAGEHVTVRLALAGSLHVTVLRADHTPLAAGHVKVTRAPLGGIDESWTIARASLDAAGQARLTGLPREHVSVEVVPADSSWPTWADVEIQAEGTTELSISIPRGDPIAGRVIDARTKRPIALARVGAPAWFGSGVRTDADGTFRIPAFPEEFSLLHVQAAGYASPRVPARDARGTLISPLVIELHAGRKVRGRIVDERGTPLEGAYVAATGRRWRDRSMEHDWVSARTDAQGRFEIADLNPALAHALIARKDGFGAAAFDLPAYETESEHVEVGDIVLRPPAILAGRVLDPAGAAIAGAEVVLSGTNADRVVLPGAVRPEIDPFGGERHARSDDLGRFAFAEVAPGQYTLRGLGDKTWIPSLPLEVTVTAAERRTGLDLRCARALSIRGRVSGPDGQPVHDVRIRAVPVGPHERAFGVGVEEDGSFAVDGLRPGAHDLVADPENEAGSAAAGPVTMRVQAGADDVVLRLPALDFVRGRIVDTDGEAVAEAWVQAIDPQCDQTLSAVLSDGQGVFALRVGQGSQVTLDAVSRALPDGTKLRARLMGVAAGSRLDVKVERPR